MIHLDTSFLIRALAADTPEDLRIRHWLTSGEALGISSLAWCEFLCGPLDTAHAALAARLVLAPEPFDAEDARAAASLFNQTGRRRGTLIDCMIAASAMRRGASVAPAIPLISAATSRWGCDWFEIPHA
jgi:predicted nucleic acid-binding protein